MPHAGSGDTRWALPVQGSAVTAIDADPEAIAEARRTASHPAIDYRLADLGGSAILADGSQDAIASLYSCIGHGNKPARDQAMLTNFRAALAPGALLVVGLANRDVALSGGESQAEFRHKGDTIRRRDRPEPDAGLLERHFTIVFADGRRLELSETWRYYAYAEMIAMLARCGLALVACHGDFAARPADPDGDPHLLYLCRRADA